MLVTHIKIQKILSNVSIVSSFINAYLSSSMKTTDPKNYIDQVWASFLQKIKIVKIDIFSGSHARFPFNSKFYCNLFFLTKNNEILNYSKITKIFNNVKIIILMKEEGDDNIIVDGVYLSLLFNEISSVSAKVNIHIFNVSIKYTRKEFILSAKMFKENNCMLTEEGNEDDADNVDLLIKLCGTQLKTK